MTPVVLFVLLLSLTAVPPGATEEGDDGDSSQDVSNVIKKANDGIQMMLIHDEIAPITARGCKWPKSDSYVTVPYFISNDYSKNERNFIIRTLESFHQATCIRFQPRTSGDRNYLNFFSGKGCWSDLDCQGGKQDVSLNRDDCLSTSKVQYEVLQAIGYQDNYVEILTDNIQSGRESNFEKVQTNNLGTPYDFNSDKKPAIVTRSNPNLNFGGVTTLSPDDIARVNRLYRCCF